MMAPDQRPWALATIALLLASASPGCLSPREPVRVDEDNIFSGTLRARICLDDAQGPVDGAAWDHSLDIQVEHAGGDAEQSVAAGETVQIDDTPFAGPGTLDIDFELLEASIVWRPGVTWEGGTSLHALLGIGWHDVEVEGSFLGLEDETSVSSHGLRIGFEVGQRVAEDVNLFTRFWGGLESAEDRDSVDSFSSELGLEYAPWKHLVLGVGWRSLEYHAEAENDPLDLESDIEIELSGPQVWLSIRN